MPCGRCVSAVLLTAVPPLLTGSQQNRSATVHEQRPRHEVGHRCRCQVPSRPLPPIALLQQAAETDRGAIRYAQPVWCVCVYKERSFLERLFRERERARARETGGRGDEGGRERERGREGEREGGGGEGGGGGGGETETVRDRDRERETERLRD